MTDEVTGMAGTSTIYKYTKGNDSLEHSRSSELWDISLNIDASNSCSSFPNAHELTYITALTNAAAASYSFLSSFSAYRSALLTFQFLSFLLCYFFLFHFTVASLYM